MKTLRTTLLIVAVLGLNVLCLWAPDSVEAQTSATKVYRGAIGNRHVQMRLNFNGKAVTGTYSYDDFGQDLKLTGQLDDQNRLELKESAAKGTQSGKIVCKRQLDDLLDSECTWSRADGTRESYMTLAEQHIAFTNGLQVVPKTLNNRKTGVGVSYPQLTGNPSLSAATQNFNQRVLELVRKAIGEFAPIDEGKGSFDTNYNVLLGSNDLVSIEMVENSDGGGAHPNNRFWSITYDLAANKELQFEDLFKPGSNYQEAIAKYVTADIDKRADALEAEEARREKRQPKPRDSSLVSEEQLSELSGWVMTPKGLMVYFDFPHVMAFFDKNFVPYSVISEHLKPNGAAARFQKS
ncbi:MAG: DUF3298 domain-containing protein [Acidobacteriota bacterium]